MQIWALLMTLFFFLVTESYPAESHQSLKLLHEQIISSSSPDHHKHSALYYLLKDLQKYSHKSPKDFASASYLPGKYRTFIDGIWQLDRFEFEVTNHDPLDGNTADCISQRKL